MRPGTLTDQRLVRLCLVAWAGLYGRSYLRVQKLHDSLRPAPQNSQLQTLMPVANGLEALEKTYMAFAVPLLPP